jgi:Fe-S cluster biogenesis protein NfuA
MGIAPSDLGVSRLVHCAAIGGYAISVVDRNTDRAVKIDVHTGVLPRDKELLNLRKSVIMEKRSASRDEHRRFFDRLSELIVQFIRVGDDNFHITGPVPFPWQEFSGKLSFVPGKRQGFQQFLRQAGLTPELVNGLAELEIVDAKRDPGLLQALLNPQVSAAITAGVKGPQAFSDLVTDTSLTTEQKVNEVIDSYIAPVLDNDGGTIDFLHFDAGSGEVSVRFLGSCANCPASILSVETLVKPPLLNIPGVYKVVHRTQLRSKDIANTAPAREAGRPA